jgi:hypothetical protein
MTQALVLCIERSGLSPTPSVKHRLYAVIDSVESLSILMSKPKGPREKSFF